MKPSQKLDHFSLDHEQNKYIFLYSETLAETFQYLPSLS